METTVFSTKFFRIQRLSGRTCATALQDIPAGTRLLKEPPMCHAIHGSYMKTYCSYCTARLPSPLDPLPTVVGADVHSCPNCRQVFYCSGSCEENDHDAHQFECKALQHDANHRFFDETDSRLLLRMLAILRRPELSAISPRRPKKPYRFDNYRDQLLDFADLCDFLSPDQYAQLVVQATSILPFADVGALEAVAKAAAAKNKMPHPPPLMGFHLTAAYTTRPHDHLTTLARQLALNPPFTDERPGGGVPLPRDEPLLLRMAQAPAVQLTARLLAIIAANARPLAPTGHGLVLHSIAAMVPAGCLPNVACGHNVMGEVTLLVTRPIAAGAELRCDIRDPTMTRAMRERANMAESLPPCRCARCAVDRTSVEGVRGAWLDRCLEGAACPRCHELLITLPRRRGSAEGDEPSKRHMCPRCCVEPDEDLVNAAARLAREVPAPLRALSAYTLPGEGRTPAEVVDHINEAWTAADSLPTATHRFHHVRLYVSRLLIDLYTEALLHGYLRRADAPPPEPFPTPALPSDAGSATGLFFSPLWCRADYRPDVPVRGPFADGARLAALLTDYAEFLQAACDPLSAHRALYSLRVGRLMVYAMLDDSIYSAGANAARYDALWPEAMVVRAGTLVDEAATTLPLLLGRAHPLAHEATLAAAAWTDLRSERDARTGKRDHGADEWGLVVPPSEAEEDSSASSDSDDEEEEEEEEKGENEIKETPSNETAGREEGERLADEKKAGKAGQGDAAKAEGKGRPADDASQLTAGGSTEATAEALPGRA